VKVKSWMVKHPVTIHPKAPLQEAIDLMHSHSIRHLPVLDGDELVGFLTESNIRQYLLPSVTRELTVEDVMIVNPITIDANASLDSAARLIHQYKIGGVPVLEKRRLVGIFTTTDIVRSFIEILGLLRKSSRIDLVLSDKDGALDEVVRLLREMDQEIISVVTETQNPKKKVHSIRIAKGGDIEPVIKALEAQGHRVISVLD